MSEVFISIITVTYNSEKYIVETIESVLYQNYENYEYIIIDGASVDNTITIISNYENKFKGKLKWISESDNGIYDAMNKGINIAKGKLIGILNSDDYLDKNALKNVNINYSETSLTIGRLVRVDSNGNVVFKKRKLSKDNIIAKLGYTIPFSHPATFVPKLIYDRVGLYNTKFTIQADYDFAYRCYLNGICFKFIDISITYYREGGVSDSNFTKRIFENISIRKQYQNRFKLYYFTFEYCIKILKGLLLKIIGVRLRNFYYRYIKNET